MTSALFRVLTRFSLRWKHLTLKFPNWEPIVALAGKGESDVPLLTAVAIDIDCPWGMGERDSLSFLHTSSLRPASLVQRGSSPAFIPIQWKNLTRLNLGSSRYLARLDSQQSLELLRGCPELVECQFEVSMGAPFETDIVKLPCLRIIRITVVLPDADMDTIPTYFSTLDMPNLSHIKFKADRAFQPIFMRSDKVDTLEYTVNEVPTDRVLELLTLGSSIRRLRLIAPIFWGYSSTPPASAISDDFLTRLTSACPTLEEVDVMLASNSDIMDETLLQFILSKTDRVPAGVARLKRVKVTFDRPRNVDIMPDLHAAIDRGLQVQIIYPQAAPSPFPDFLFRPWEALDVAEQSDEWNRGFWDTSVYMSSGDD